MVAFLDRVEANFTREYMKDCGIEDPDEFFRQVSESVSDGSDIIWRGR